MADHSLKGDDDSDDVVDMLHQVKSSNRKFRKSLFQRFFSALQEAADEGLQDPGEYFQLMAGSGHGGDLALVARIRDELRLVKQATNS